MIILPDKNIPKTKFLMPIHKKEWCVSSQIQKKDMFGNENLTRFSIIAKLHDGHILWKGIFYDREDFDAFLFAIAKKTLPYEREIWDLPNQTWTLNHGWLNIGWVPDLGINLNYYFITEIFKTTPTGSNQSYTMPNDWSSSNEIHTIGGGASGGSAWTSGGAATASGGGGGAWNYVLNTTYFTAGESVTFRIASGGTGTKPSSNGTGVSGNDGGDTWFGDTTLAGTNTAVGSKGGSPGTGTTGTTQQSGGAGGVGTSGVGTDSNDGGRGGNITRTGGSVGQGSGAGGAAGQTGNGNNGGDYSGSAAQITNGGAGDAGAGGAATTATVTGSGGVAGNPGTEWSSSPTYGSGGGSSGARGGAASGGTGGLYGGGGGGSGTGGGAAINSGSGASGIIYLNYTPNLIKNRFNMPMLGM